MNKNRITIIKESTKIFSILTSLYLIFSGIFGIFSISFDIKNFILDIYICIFGVIIISGEFGKLKNIFGFASSYIGRGIFQIFIGLTLVFFDWEKSKYNLEFIAGFLMLVIGCIELILCCSCKNIENKLSNQTENVNERTADVELNVII